MPAEPRTIPVECEKIFLDILDYGEVVTINVVDKNMPPIGDCEDDYHGAAAATFINVAVIHDHRLAIVELPGKDTNKNLMIVYGYDVDGLAKTLYIGHGLRIIVVDTVTPRPWLHDYIQYIDGRFEIGIEVYHDDGRGYNFRHTYIVKGKTFEWRGRKFGVIERIVKNARELSPKARSMLLDDEAIIKEIVYALGAEMVY